MANLNPKTVEQYVQILEQAFIIFRLQPYTLNERTGIKKLRKIYFRDL
jgi:predicted AAA+ superfamily ATPase